jgi:hypothetical protein
MTPQRAARLPWTVGQLLFWVTASSVGLLVLLVSWWLVGGQVRIGPQIPWLNAGMAGLAVAAVGNVLWLLQGRRAVAERTRAVVGRLSDRPPPRRRTVAPARRAADGGFVATEAMTHYHRPDCLLVAGRSARPQARAEHVAAGRTPCGACRP